MSERASSSCSSPAVRPDPEIDRIWAKAGRKRWAAYKTGRAPTFAYETVMVKLHPAVGNRSRTRGRGGVDCAHDGIIAPTAI